MPKQFFLAFLGPYDQYLASYWQSGNDGTWLGETKFALSEGLPVELERYCSGVANEGYVYDLCGHDFLSHTGCVVGRGLGVGQVDKGKNLLAEITMLHSFTQEIGSTDLRLTLGPKPGSFFADAYRKKRYRWTGLPKGLEDAVQRLVRDKKYGTIYGVAMNSVGGWVLLWDKGKKYQWDGDLPPELTNRLQDGAQAKVRIHKLYLNHQNLTDYFLLFDNGKAYVSLDDDFESKLKPLVASVVGERKLDWHFKSSHPCTVEDKNRITAKYYNLRSRYNLKKGNAKLALQYAIEASKFEQSDEDYALALVAVHLSQSNPTAGANLRRSGSDDEDALFRYRYNEMLRGSNSDVTSYEERWRRIVNGVHSNEQWSWAESLRPPPQIEFQIQTGGSITIPELST